MKQTVYKFICKFWDVTKEDSMGTYSFLSLKKLSSNAINERIQTDLKNNYLIVLKCQMNVMVVMMDLNKFVETADKCIIQGTEETIDVL